MTPPDRRPEASLRCVPAADLTAFARGALPELRRAEISRHLLRCPRCHTATSGTGELFQRLRAFGTTPSWEGELGTAVAIARARARARSVGTMAGAGVGLLLAAGVALLPFAPSAERGPGVAGAPSPAAPTRSTERVVPMSLPVLSSGYGRHPAAAGPALSDDAHALLRAQASDGRWVADDTLGTGRHDEAATGLALLAILEGRPDALREPSVARAVASATRWLKGRERALEASTGTLRDDAVATSALLAVYAQTGDAGVRAQIDRGVRRLSRAVASEPALDPASAGWTRLALARARDLGWSRSGLPASDAVPPAEPPGRAPAYPLGGVPGETLVAKALALVDRSPQG